MVGPLAAVLEQLWYRAPQRQRVIAKMVVQFDQAREDRPAGLHRRDIVEAGWRRLGAVLHGDDGAPVDEHDRVGLDRERVVHGDHASCQRQLRARERVDGPSLRYRPRCRVCCASPCSGLVAR